MGLLQHGQFVITMPMTFARCFTSLFSFPLSNICLGIYIHESIKFTYITILLWGKIPAIETKFSGESYKPLIIKGLRSPLKNVSRNERNIDKISSDQIGVISPQISEKIYS
jgi:hypothetical protein